MQRFELLRSDGSRRVCSPAENADYFAATIGGLGLTGLITWVAISLKRIASPMISVENTRFDGLEDFFTLNAAAEAAHEYTVAWIDCLAAKPRGIYMAGDHAKAGDPGVESGKPLSVPLTPPFSLINGCLLYTSRCV